LLLTVLLTAAQALRHSQTLLAIVMTRLPGFRRQAAGRPDAQSCGLGRLRVPTQLRRKRVAAF